MDSPRRPAWLADIQRPPAAVPADVERPAPLLFDGEHRPIRTPEAWQARRGVLISSWREFLGGPEVPATDLAIKVLEEDRPEGVVRQLLRYEAEPGLPVEGYLLRPEGDPKTPRPGVVVLHPTTDDTIRQPAGLAGPEEKQIGLHLARRGFVAFCPRCFLWQYSRPGQLAEAVDWLNRRPTRSGKPMRGMAKMLLDAIRAVDLLVAQAGVDPARVGAIGHSLGAKEVLYLAAFDPRVRAAVSSEGGIGLTFSNWDAPWYLGDAIRRPGFALDQGQVLALAAPRAVLLVGGESADGDRSWPHVEAVLPVWSLLGAPEAVGLFNHRQGHAFPKPAQDRCYEWLDWFLRPTTPGEKVG
jgi:pimeloyl-ACP methyl ester carboxylesterase